MKVLRIKTNGDAKETGKYMRRMVNVYKKDMLPYASLPLNEVYDIIKAIPYREDPPHEETLMRPYYTMRGMGWGGDCDDKCIALASYASLRGIPYRFVAVRKPDKKTLHHVLCELYIMGRWITADPTYQFNVLGHEHDFYQERVII